MEYKLIGDNDYNNVKHTILKNRGIKDISRYLKLDDNCLYSYELLDNIDDGYKMLKHAIDNGEHIYIVVDCDVDGYTSASTLYRYITITLGYKNVTYLLHTGKQHGLSNDILNQIDVNKGGLIVLPDAGTNDYKQCKELKELEFKILVIDHHDKEYDNKYATIINNQTCKYPNKNLCGMGVVLKFIELLDDEYWTNEAENYADLNAFANISDSMDLRECETKYIVNIGMKNITHPLLKALINKQSYSIKNTDNPTIIDISFSITPLINAIARVGTLEEKEIMFKAFLQEYEEYEYKPRKSKNNPQPEVIMESIYDRVDRLGTNVRQRQNKIRDKALGEVFNLFDEQNTKNSICFINTTKLENDVREIGGLIAIKTADKYKKPCIVLRKDNHQTKNDNIIFSGSARNVNDGDIESLKSELSSSRLFKYVAGHENAFGLSIMKDNIPIAINYFNKKYPNNVIQPHKVDFQFNNNIEYRVIKDIHSMNNLFCNRVKEPLIAIENVYVDFVGFEEFGNEDKKHWKFQNGMIQYIKFNVSDEDELINIDTFETDSVQINIVGKACINGYGGNVIPQIIVEDYEIIKL